MMQLIGKKIVFQPLFEDCHCVTVDFGSLKGKGFLYSRLLSPVNLMFCCVQCFGFFFNL